MPSLWLPYPDNPWEWKRVPFVAQDNSLDMDKWGKQDFIEFMPYFVDVFRPIEPDTKGQRDLLDDMRAFYRGVAKWLGVRVLGRLEMLPELRSPQLAIYESYADLMVATLKFCEQIYPKLQRAQQAESYEILWGMCLISRFLYQLRALGFDGNPYLRADGKNKGKEDYLQEDMQTIHKFKEVLKNGEPNGEPITDFDPHERIIELLLWDAIQLANDENDAEIECACKEYMDAWSKYTRITLKESEGLDFQLRTVLSPTGEVHVSRKGRKNRKPEAFKPKRRPGRPPKGSKL
jgi:hypothetical protein